MPILAAILFAGAVAMAEPPVSGGDGPGIDSSLTIPENLLRPIPRSGAIGPMPGADPSLTASRLSRSSASRRAEEELRSVRRRWLGSRRDPELRAEGLRRLREFTEPTALLPMHAVMRREGDDVRLAMLDHFAALGSPGQAALAYIAIHESDPDLRGEALRRLQQPADPGALAMLDEALRSRTHAVVNQAGFVAGHLQALQAIPHLIFAQVAADDVPESGDLAWIAIGSQISYVADLVPVVGNGVAAFQPIPGVIMEGVVLQVQDAVVYSYRVEVHRSLVAMTSGVPGTPAESMGYDPRRWFAWFNETYVPGNLARLETERAVEQAAAAHRERSVDDDALP